MILQNLILCGRDWLIRGKNVVQMLLLGGFPSEALSAVHCECPSTEPKANPLRPIFAAMALFAIKFRLVGASVGWVKQLVAHSWWVSGRFRLLHFDWGMTIPVEGKGPCYWVGIILFTIYVISTSRFPKRVPVSMVRTAPNTPLGPYMRIWHLLQNNRASWGEAFVESNSLLHNSRGWGMATKTIKQTAFEAEFVPVIWKEQTYDESRKSSLSYIPRQPSFRRHRLISRTLDISTGLAPWSPAFPFYFWLTKILLN